MFLQTTISATTGTGTGAGTGHRCNTGNFAEQHSTVDRDPTSVVGGSYHKANSHNHRQYHMQTGILLRIDSCAAASNTNLPADMAEAEVVPEDPPLELMA